MIEKQAAIELRDVYKTFRTRGEQVMAVDGITLEIETGSVVALLGPNGAGKTTTIDMILGLTTPSSGSISVLGTKPRAATVSGRVSAVLQSGGLLRDLSVGETVQLIASTFPDPIPVSEALSRAGITSIKDRKVAKCSGGEQQRLRFALA